MIQTLLDFLQVLEKSLIIPANDNPNGSQLVDSFIHHKYKVM